MSHSLSNLRRILSVSLLSLAGYLTLAFLRINFSSVDNSTNYWATTIQNDSLTVAAVAISILFDTTIVLVFSLAVSLFLFYRNLKKQSLLLLVAMAGTALFTSISKILVYSPRPPNGLIVEIGYSFPSGHVTAGLVFFGLLTYFSLKLWNSAERKTGMVLLFLTMASIIGFDRIYLNVHWLSDVLGGYLLGTFWLTFSIMIFRYLETDKDQIAKKFRRQPKTSSPKDS